MQATVLEKILIQNFIDMNTQFSDSNSYIEKWQIIEKWSKKIPKAKSCLTTLSYAYCTIKNILKHDRQGNYNHYDRASIAELCKVLCIDGYNKAKKNVKYNSEFIKLIFKRLKEYGYTTTDVIENPSALTDEEAKKIIMSIPKYYLLCYNAGKSLTLEQALEANDLFDCLNDDKLTSLEKILDVGCYIEKTEDTKVFNPDKMKKLADCMLKRTDILNNLENAKKALEFYYQILPNLVDEKVEEYKKRTNDNESRYLNKSTPVFSFAYELLKKYKDRNENDFNELKKYIGDITSNILKETSDWSDAIRVFFGLKNFYDRKESAQLSLNCSLNRRLNKMLNFLYKNRIIKNLTAVTKFSVRNNEEFSCSWSEWFRELWRCLRDDFLTFWKNSYNITKAVILKKFLNEFDKISVKLDRTNNKTNNKSASITLSELLKEVNEFIPISETTKLQK